ncbi:MAG: DUF433 domain-containing protein [Okeania sp. SIO2H7]|nr:DUF433 domain-containing protein [Okeania sp. SIO2H7]
MIKDELIIKSSEIMSGTPVFKGTRVPIKNLTDYLEAGDSLDEFLDDFPSVSREQAIAVLHLAFKSLIDLKSDSFQAVNIDDIRIDITRNLDIQLSLYSDSSAEQTPKENVNGGEAIREVEMEAIMNISTAKSLIRSLQGTVEELEEAMKVQEILETPPTPEEKARAKSIRERAFAKAKKAGPRPAEEVKAEFRAAWKAIAKEAEEMRKIAKEGN